MGGVDFQTLFILQDRTGGQAAQDKQGQVVVRVHLSRVHRHYWPALSSTDAASQASRRQRSRYRGPGSTSRLSKRDASYYCLPMAPDA